MRLRSCFLTSLLFAPIWCGANYQQPMEVSPVVKETHVLKINQEVPSFIDKQRVTTLNYEAVNNLSQEQIQLLLFISLMNLLYIAILFLGRVKQNSVLLLNALKLSIQKIKYCYFFFHRKISHAHKNHFQHFYVKHICF